MKNLRRRDLPNFAILNSDYNYDPEKLLQSYLYSLKINEEKKLNHRLTINSVEDHTKNLYYGTDNIGYEQLNLTSYDAVDSSQGYFQSTWQWFSRAELTPRERMSYYRKNLRRTLESDANPTVETSYNYINELSDEYLKSILSKFKGKVSRVRWAVSNPGMKLKPHIDYDTIYAVRYHFPVLTNLESTMSVERNGKIQTVHVPITGKTWFLNPGFTHWVENNGSTPRVHLIVSVIGQEDLVNSTSV
jgi:hypothetical protein